MNKDFDELSYKYYYASYEDYNARTYDGITQNLWNLPIEEWNPQIINLLLNLNKRVNDLEYEIKELKQSLEVKK